MSSGSQNRTRSERVASLQMPPGKFERFAAVVRQGRVWTRAALALLAGAIVLIVCQTWKPPFSFREGQIPPRDIYARVQFEVPDTAKTQTARELCRREVECFYINRSEALDQLRERLKGELFLMLEAPSFLQLSEDERKRTAWGGFYEGDETNTEETAAQAFSQLKAMFADDEELEKLDNIVRAAMLPAMEDGLLRSLEHEIEDGDQGSINVYDEDSPDKIQTVPVERVRIATASSDLMQRVLDSLVESFKLKDKKLPAELIAGWLVHPDRLPETLQYDEARSEEARAEAEAKVDTVMTVYYPSRTVVAEAGMPLTEDQVALLRVEWKAMNDQLTIGHLTVRFIAYGGMIAALYLLCGSYIFYAHNRMLITDVSQLARLLALTTITVIACWPASRDGWRVELVPLVLAAMTATVAYGRELALLITSTTALGVTLLIGQDVSSLVVYSAAALSSISLLGRIRTRTRLISVGASAAAITMATVVGVGIVTVQTAGLADPGVGSMGIYQTLGIDTNLRQLIREACWSGTLVLIAGALMTAMLPLVEYMFKVQTDLSLLELGDPSHTLLRQLAQLAPGTYNHSINVASIGESAAEAIGANGLLLRVGAYFHDIGKMFKPDYFIENQAGGPNQHDALQPAMSTLVIIAHVKDGADLARKENLPESMVDFILQHHGTTLVEYFYREASKRSEEDPNKEEVAEQDFRYPGPKPQTLEAAILMLADGVESASRTLVDPTPARIQNLVDQIAMKRLEDGQFDECGLTLKQLDRVKKSIVKSLTAIYHARVKYPGQQTA